nr:MAG TPA: hypothetical protein [Caudoviricetes sp.]
MAYNTTTTHINNNPCTLRHRTPAAVRTNEKAYNYEKDCYTTHDPYEVGLGGRGTVCSLCLGWQKRLCRLYRGGDEEQRHVLCAERAFPRIL